MRMIVLGLCLLGLAAPARADCVVIDFMTLPLPVGDPVEIALEAAYPGADLDLGAGIFRTPEGVMIPYAPARDVTPAARLDGATIGDMFTYPYPLDFDLEQRRVAWIDPGRIRNDAFFRALYFDNATAAAASLQRVVFQSGDLSVPFLMTDRNCVATQLTAALANITAMSPGIDRFFEESGGSFNWRVIAGSDRLSSHSFGAAFDLNVNLGGYWRWTGVAEGQVTDYDNKIPAELVQVFERYGFIWGGKWNHFDGMHFEYRPELILYARLRN
jgi:hypothetical protein